jgi:pyruvate formate lyase activating enzyme
MKGLIFDVQRFCLHDGPGIRTVIFFKGCPLNCIWCANPEGQDFSINIFFSKEKCKKDCFDCVNLCKQNAISKNKGNLSIDYKKCNFCNLCIERCPNQALKKVGDWYTIDELAAIAFKDIKFFGRSGGGVTFSGGEPTGQIGFLKLLVDRLKKFNLHLCLETCGYFEYSRCVDTIKKIDLIYFDLKILDNEKAKIYTGNDFNKIGLNLKKLSKEVGNRIVARIPLIPGITTKQNNLKKIKELLQEAGVYNLELLPFHKLGIKKFEMLGKKNKLNDICMISEEEIEEYLNFFDSFNVKIEK